VCTLCGDRTERAEPALGHDFALTWTVDREPTCSQAGQKSRHCSRCSAITSVVSLVPLNHNFSTITVAPTCTDTGYRLRTCVRCGFQTKDQYKDALGHTAGPWVTEQAPTCTEKGVRIAHCTVCGAVAAQSSVAAAGHSYRETTLAPTCTEKGYTLRTCSRCGAETKSNTVKALGHDYPATGVVTKAPGCTEKGEETLYCTRCGAPKIRTLSALGHNYDAQWTVDKAPTCTAQGEKSHRCSRCAKRSDVTAIPRADHTPVADSAVAPTCEAKGKEGGAHCRDCGKVLAAPTQTAALGHAFSNTGVLKEATCTQPGSVGRVCARCGKTEEAATDALGHSYDTQWTIDQAATCTAKG
ncbi:hypothetical protein, partial [Methanobrevibacter gottschalkii]|uniref:hypothetical protein n=1 Tax=Methanobrevibacter gottschalkii TaxID=190974 RepID=UPI0038D24093